MKRDTREFKQASPKMMASPIQKATTKPFNDEDDSWYGEWSAY